MERKPIFAKVRELLGRGLNQSEVDELDHVLDVAEGRRVPDVPSAAEDPHVPRFIGAKGKALIKSFEGYAKELPGGLVEAYWDPHGRVWTIAWGLTGFDIVKGTTWTKEEAERRFDRALVVYANEVAAAIEGTPTSQEQFDALVAFHYNTGKIRKATLTRKHLAGDFAGASKEFGRWVYSGGKKLKGLVRRRAAEADLYRSGS